MLSLDLKVTPEMEKAMQQNHGVGYAVYEMKLNQRMNVEKEREKSYLKSLEVNKEMSRKVHR